MSTVGIIAEFNPFHNGHKHLIGEAGKSGDVVAVISGNFVQRGDTAIAEKRLRAKAALENGVDLVLEMPVCWSMSTAQNFALGGVSILNNIGCDTIMFSSECGDVNRLKQTAEIIGGEEFKNLLSEYSKSGKTFAASRQAAAVQCGADDKIISGANNNLAVEYIYAADKIGANLDFKTIKRLGSTHDDNVVTGEYASASFLRKKLLSKNLEEVFKYIPKNTEPLLKYDNISDINRIETAILSVLRSRAKKEFAYLPDISEGIENLLYNASRTATSLNELYNSVKTKRYTMARVRRLVLSAFLGIDSEWFLKQPPYIRVLGFNSRGEQILKEKAKSCPVPVITRVSDYERFRGEILKKSAARLFETECRATDLYALSLAKPLPCGIEYTSKIIKI